MVIIQIRQGGKWELSHLIGILAYVIGCPYSRPGISLNWRIILLPFHL